MKHNRRTTLETTHGLGLGLAIIGVVACAINADVVHLAAASHAANAYVLSGSVDGVAPFHVDDALDVYLNDTLIHTDGIPAPGSPDVRIPINFSANVGDTLHFVVRDTSGICTRMTRLILTDAVGRFGIADAGFDLGCGRPSGNQGISHDFSYVIPVLEDLPPFEDQLLPGRAWAGPVQGPDGLLYGLTYNGGDSNLGTIYSFDPALSVVTVLHSFDGAVDGATPYDELALNPATGKFYGTTARQGPSNSGTVFEFDPSTNDVITLRSDFAGYANPQGPLVQAGGYLYGALYRTNGGVFRMATDGSDFVVIHPFVDFGASPGPLTLGPDGLLYGVTTYGGGVICNPNFSQVLGCGSVYRLKPVLPGDTDTQFQTLYTFQDTVDVNRNNGPQGKLIYGSDGLLYGTTFYKIFRLDPDNPVPSSTFQFIWTAGRGISLSAVEGADQRLYGADYTGTNNQGRIFSVEKDGTDAIVLYDFSATTGSTSNGPAGRLYRNAVGTVFGTTEWTNASQPFPGTIFAISGTGVNPPTTPTLSNVAITSSINENDLATLSGQISDADATSTFTLTINWGDGAAQTLSYPAGTTSFSQTHRYLDDNPTGTSSDLYTVNLTLTNSRGGSSTGSASLTVNNVAPGGLGVGFTPLPIVVGAMTTLNGTVADVGTRDTHTVVITWGDGTPATTVNLAAGVLSFSVTHQFTVSGTLTIFLVWSDDDLGSNAGDTSITVQSPLPPVLSNVAVTPSIYENEIATLSGRMSDANAATPFALTINWGDGSAQTFNYPAGTTSFSQTHRYLDDNPSGTSSDSYSIALTLTNGQGGSTTGSASLIVNNLAAGLSGFALSPSPTVVGATTTLSGVLNDPGTLDPHTLVIDWADGTPNTTVSLPAGVSPFSVTHQFALSGTLIVSLTISDDDLGSGTSTRTVIVNPLPPAAPSNLTAVAVSPTQVNLSWKDNATNETGFRVERCVGNGKCTAFVQVGFDLGSAPGTNTISVIDPTATPGTNNTYRVLAFNGGGNSAYSNTAAARTPKK